MAITETNFRFIQDLIRTHSAIILENGKDYLVEARLSPLAKQSGFDSLDAFIDRLRQDPRSTVYQEQIVDALTTNETSFFRDLYPFDALREQILPAMIAEKAATKTLNIWSAASSTGQEAYTIAMVIREHFPALQDWSVRILGTDLSPTVLAKAKEGSYSQLDVNRGLPVAMLIKYFSNVKSRWVVRDELKRLVEFRQLNLVKPWTGLPLFDIIFLRNVLIYFDVETKRSILTNARRQLHPSGYLLLGGAETTMNLDANWVTVTRGNVTMYQQKPSLAAAA